LKDIQTLIIFITSRFLEYLSGEGNLECL